MMNQRLIHTSKIKIFVLIVVKRICFTANYHDNNIYNLPRDVINPEKSLKCREKLPCEIR